MLYDRLSVPKSTLCHICVVGTLKKGSVLEHVHASYHQELHLLNSSFDRSDLFGTIRSLNLEVSSKVRSIPITNFLFFFCLCIIV